ncbi:MAG: HAMP domain-containing histidine kinase [Methylococcales bacterium]|nr:HAMP domain-containing histidine kinase [Methylococcales bacterium]
MKGKKISHLIGLHTLLSACAGILLAIVLFLGFQTLEKDQQQLNQDVVILKDILRMKETYREWLIMMDLVLGNNQTYLTRGTQRQANTFVDIISQIQEKVLLEAVKQNLKNISLQMQPSIKILQSILDGEKVSNKAMIQFDHESLRIIETLSEIKIAVSTQAKLNAEQAEKQRQQVILQSIFSGIVFIILMILQWLFLSIYLVRPMQNLNNAVNLAREDHQQFHYTNDTGTIEVKELAENAREFINNLEEKIIARTYLYKAERDKAMVAAEIKTNFLSLMNHELRTPLNAIMGFSQLLDFGSLTKDQKNYQQEIINASNRLLKLLNRIFELIKIEDNDYHLNLSQITFHKVLDDSIESFSDNCKEKNINLTTTIQAEEVTLLGNAQCLFDIFTSLISNAIKYSHKEGEIKIQCYQDGSELFFSITDQGTGIKPTLAQSIFEPFVDRQKDFVDGLGISLYVTRRFIELMGGSIGFDSTEGQGSQFYFRLPVSSE